MRTIYMKYHSAGEHRVGDGSNTSAVHNSESLVRLSPVNQFPILPCRKDCDVAVAYSKGKMSAMPDMPWDVKPETRIIGAN